ncbi:MAG TPA: response regulator [Thermoanaerobaculia bacterium]|nr:response regulator [Thermoanaerobaculia bacterium]
MSAPKPAAERSALILVVERDPHVRALERFFLEQAGFHVEFADDGEIGLELAKKLKPQIVLTEILVPRKDGLSVCRELKSDPATAHTIVLVLSMLAAEERALEAGADAFLAKPLNDALLIDSVRRLLDSRRSSVEHPP